MLRLVALALLATAPALAQDRISTWCGGGVTGGGGGRGWDRGGGGAQFRSSSMRVPRRKQVTCISMAEYSADWLLQLLPVLVEPTKLPTE